MAYYPAYYYDPAESDSSGTNWDAMAGCVGGGEGYEKVDSYETNSVYLCVDKSAIPDGAVISNISVSFQYKQLTYQDKTGLFYSSKLSWQPVLLTNPTISGTKISSLGTVTNLVSSSQIASGIGTSKSYTSKSVSANVNATKASNNIVGIKFDIDSDNVADVHFYFNAVSITVTYTVPKYTITTSVSPTNGGTVTDGGSYEYGKTATLKATPASGYKFVKWNDGNTSASRTITVTGNATYIAYFEVDKINNIYVNTVQPKAIYFDDKNIVYVVDGTIPTAAASIFDTVDGFLFKVQNTVPSGMTEAKEVYVDLKKYYG